jgi:hypothetical protein
MFPNFVTVSVGRGSFKTSRPLNRRVCPIPATAGSLDMMRSISFRRRDKVEETSPRLSSLGALLKRPNPHSYSFR